MTVSDAVLMLASLPVADTKHTVFNNNEIYYKNHNWVIVENKLLILFSLLVVTD